MQGHASAYIDIKTVYEASATDPNIVAQLGTDALPARQIERLQLYRSFIKAVITEIKDELKKKLRDSPWDWLQNKVTGSVDELFESLDDLLEGAERRSSQAYSV